VGKHIFKIKHYWLRYEFAPSRGQIHTHILAIADLHKEMNIASRFNYDRKAKAIFLEHLVKEYFGMKCDFNDTSFTKEQQKKLPHPATVRFMELNELDIDKFVDEDNLLLSCQKHVCSTYCMRVNKTTKKRICRAGCGSEKTTNKCDTRGFIKRKQACLVHDYRGHTKLEIKRNTKKIIQSSMHLLQSWRANSDIQLILYESKDLKSPDPSEIAQVTDYIVSYQCKGNETQLSEKQMIKEFVSQFKTDEETAEQEHRTMARKTLNKILGSRMISKQETMVQLTGLPLWQSSESFLPVSLTGSYSLSNSSKTPLQYYKKRKANLDMSLNDYIKNDPEKKIKTGDSIPHYIGVTMNPVYPPTEPYARQANCYNFLYVNTYYL